MPSSPAPSTRTYKSSRQIEMDKPVKTPKKLKPKKLPKLNKKNIGRLLIATLVVMCLVLFVQYRSAHKKLNGNQAENVKAEKQLSKIILLPSDEKPTIATVKDVQKLKTQPFFKDAQDGDKVFIYTKSRKAILYRPDTKMIVNVQPISN